MTLADDFLTLWSDYRTLIAKFIHAKLRYDTRETREDMVQEVYFRAWSAMCKGCGPHSYPKAWLVRIAHNLIVDYYSVRSRRPLDEVLDAYGEDGERLGTSIAPHEIVEQAQTVAHVQCLARSLTPAQELVILHRLDGYAYAEIAHEMDANEGAVKAVGYRATINMRRYLDQL